MLKSHALAGAVIAAATAGGATAVAVPALSSGPAAAGPLATLTAAGPAGTPGTARSCNADAHWPAYVQGQPDGFDAGDDGVYLWHNPAGGWGLRVSHPLLPGRANKVVFSGVIISRGTIGHVTPVKNESADRVKIGPKGHVLRFRFVDYGGVDGVDFTTTCTPGLQVRLAVDHSTVAPKFVHLGDQKVNPGSDPFRIRRRDSDTATLAVPPRTKRPGPAAGHGTGGATGSTSGLGAAASA